MRTFRGKVWTFGDDIDTDAILPARYMNSPDPRELARHCMEDADPSFMEKISPDDIIVAGKNFGCGSSREHAPLAIREAGIACVIAGSFARIFYRNAINIGLPILESPDAAAFLEEGCTAEVNLQTGEIMDLASGRKFSAAAFPSFMQEIMAQGGLINFVKGKV
ncbi:MAG: 3-isopropylmalate dehydratase small subunit [Dethiobacteria bacterium]|jgi:3-isopropylmalate/(R)-2-methylmalate dehydratase small subunit|nr:3-isopropylmalate dehydratase small subunit [Oscillospiraceae bacterium]